MKQFTAEEKKAYAENKQAEVKTLANKLTVFLASAMESKAGFEKLSSHYRISGVYSYSFKNNMLIMLQGGTICNSFNNWKKLGRTVTEKSRIGVFAPLMTKTIDKVTGEESYINRGFKLVPTFDITQTTGKELTYDHNSQDCEKGIFDKVQSVLERLSGVSLVSEYTGNARGYSDGEKMAVSTMSNNADKVKTALHEYAHHVLHTGAKAEKANLSRETKEVEAESVAYLTLAYIGVDFDLSADYVACYKAGISAARLDKVLTVADSLIKELTGKTTNEEKE